MLYRSHLTTSRGNAALALLPALLFAVAAGVGWYQYYNLVDSSEKAQSEIKRTVAKLERELERTNIDKTTLENRNQSLTADSRQLQTLQQQIDELESSLDSQVTERQVLIDKEASLQQEIQQLRSQMEQMLREVNEQTSALEQELAQRQSVESQLSEQVSEVSSAKQQLLDQLRAEEARRAKLQAEVSSVNSAIDDKSSELAAARGDVESLQSTIDQIREQQQREAAQFDELKLQLESELNESRVQITQLKNRMTVINLSNEVLFASGSAELKSEGKRVLTLIASTLNQYPDRLISIEGHTDNVPIGPNSDFSSNWDLSSARALAALQHLQDDSDVAAERLRIVGHGEYRPIGDNDSVVGRARNRRIEIRLMPDLQESPAS